MHRSYYYCTWTVIAREGYSLHFEHSVFSLKNLKMSEVNVLKAVFLYKANARSQGLGQNFLYNTQWDSNNKFCQHFGLNIRTLSGLSMLGQNLIQNNYSIPIQYLLKILRSNPNISYSKRSTLLMHTSNLVRKICLAKHHSSAI